MMIDRMPTLFVSHGAPSLLVDQDPTFDFFKRLGWILPRPKAVLCEFGSYPLDARPQAYAVEFEAWLFEAIRSAQEDELINYRSRAPHAARTHPTEDHIWPLFVPLGAAGAGATGRRLYDGYTYGILSMAAYAWGV